VYNSQGEVLLVFVARSPLNEAENEKGLSSSSPAAHSELRWNYFLTFAFPARAADR
jgi:hypothetical protein